MMKRFLLVLALVLALCGMAQAADVTLKWDASTGATGYRLYRSIDAGATWTMVQDNITATEITLTGQPDTGMVLYRVGAYNAVDEAIRTWSGAWYNRDWQPPAEAGGTGIQ